MQKYTSRIRNWLKPLALSSVIFLSAAHHAFNYWELPAPVSAVLFFIIVPIGAIGLTLLGKKIAPHSSQFPKASFRLYLAGALLISSFITWRNFRAPVSYQTIVITPDLSQTRTIGLLELKANGNVVPLRQAALQGHWQEVNGILYANKNSKPITISFKCAANAPILILFETTPQSGRVNISFGYEIMQVDLNQADAGNSLVQFAARYRGIPNWIFIPALILLDVITFGALILFFLIVQMLGQTFPSSTAMGQTPPRTSDLNLLFVIAFFLHLINILSVPLLLNADSRAYLQGAAHLLKYGNLDGVSVATGPVTTFLFAPVMLLFGRNPWGMKILLHLISLGCIPVCYRLGWQISRNRWLAIMSALTIIFSPDVYFYSNYVMSDLLNIFLVLLFCTLLLSALETMSPKMIFATLITASFASLLRFENVVLLIISVLALTATCLWRWFSDRSQTIKRTIIHIGFAFTIAILPILWWSGHNQKIYGTTNHFGGILYDGWVYFGDASRLSFSDPNSIAIQTIQAVVEQHPIDITDKSGVATAGETSQALMESGYTSGQAMELFKTAALDSIRRNPELSIQLLFLKYKTGLHPEITYDLTYSLPGEPIWANEIKLRFFDAENVSSVPLIRLQQKVNELVSLWYPHLYPTWVLFCVLTLALSFFRRPAIHWIALVAITATRIFIPLTMSVPFWRYTLSGWMLLQIIAIAWVWIFINGAKALLKPDGTTQ